MQASDTSGQGEFKCPECFRSTRFVRASACGTKSAYFAHKDAAPLCKFGTSDVTSSSDDATSDVLENESQNATHRAMSPWHTQWQNSAKSDICREEMDVGEDRRPRDLAHRETGDIVELQHSFITECDFVARNASAPSTILWIFDATGKRFWNYGDCTDKLGRSVSFCEDGFRVALPTSENVIVLFHCADGLLRKVVCDAHCLLDLPDDGRVHVRLLCNELPPNVRTMLDRFFDDRWPLSEWPGSRVEKSSTLHVASGCVKVISEEGRLFFDGVHRALFGCVPTAPLTVFQGPPGAGKTTLLKQTICKWKYINPRPKVLVVTFNRNNAQVLKQEICANNVDVKTFDSLCFIPFKGRKFDTISSDESLLNTHFAEEVDRKRKGRWALKNKLKHGGGAGCFGIVSHRLKHPNAQFSLCANHKKLTQTSHLVDWTAAFGSFPLCKVIEDASTYQSRRYLCDTGDLLRQPLSNYDVIIVDEMQDLLSAQEQRLLRQASCPIVLIGDVNQKINDFTNKFNNKGCCTQSPTKCCMEEEKGLDLPASIEMYGTHRLDRFTANFLEDRTGVRMCSYRDESERSSVKWKATMQFPENSLVLCRKRESVIQMATQTDGMKIVAGRNIVKDLKRLKWDTNDETPFATYVRGLTDKEYVRVTKLLEDGAIELGEFASRTDISAASTVHQCKGFECDHVALHEELLECDERAILYVAMTRHRKSLTILKSIDNTPTTAAPPVDMLESATQSKRSTADFSATAFPEPAPKMLKGGL